MNEFDELRFWTIIKTRPELYLGQKSIVRLDIFIKGISYALNYSSSTFPYFDAFNDWYMEKQKVDNRRGYVIWWNHILYINGNQDDVAFDFFVKYFEKYLKEIHNVTLPEVIG
ncbi:MAG: hypothetical protein NC337_07085 [Roseburia sp.]|nr:hypothetical protein [Roseburia sp.]